MTSFNFEGEFGQKYGVSMGTTGEHPRVFAETLGIQNVRLFTGRVAP